MRSGLCSSATLDFILPQPLFGDPLRARHLEVSKLSVGTTPFPTKSLVNYLDLDSGKTPDDGRPPSSIMTITKRGIIKVTVGNSEVPVRRQLDEMKTCRTKYGELPNVAITGDLTAPDVVYSDLLL